MIGEVAREVYGVEAWQSPFAIQRALMLVRQRLWEMHLILISLDGHILSL
jgi:hypothetical protein